MLVALAPAQGWAGVPRGCDDDVGVDVRTSVLEGTTIKGNWLSPPSMNRVLFVLTECVPSYRGLIESQSVLIARQKGLVETSSRTIGALEVLSAEHEERASHWKEAYTGEHERAVELEERSGSFFASPTFWLGVGMVVGAGATIGIAYAVRDATP